MNLCAWLGRPFKPLALAMTASLLVIFVFNILDIGILDGSWQGDVLGGAALVGASLLTAAWIVRSQEIAEIGLAVAAWIWGTRALLAFALVGPHVEGSWFSMCWAGAAAGAFYLERRDRARRQRRRD